MRIYHLSLSINEKHGVEDVLDDVMKLIGDTATTIKTVIEVRTDNPAVIAVVEELIDQEIKRLIEPAPIPEPPAPKAKRTPRKAKRVEPEQAAEVTIAVPSVEPGVSDEPAMQQYNWMLPDGKQTNNVGYALKNGKLQIGDKCRHIKRGEHIVVAGRDGLTLDRVRA